MARILLYLCVICVIFKSVLGQSETCPDCMSIVSCPEGIALLAGNVTNEMKSTLRNAFCGFKGRDPYVCCGMLKLDNHPNLKYLPQKCGVMNGDRIFGGTVPGLYEYPWMVLISFTTNRGLEFKCGGSIISERYVLTAAHCIIGQQLAGVRVGEHNIKAETDCEGTPPNVVCESRLQDLRIEKSIVHENYTSSPVIQNDIGLLRLKKPIDFIPRNARPICLPTTKELRNRNIYGETATVAGWGYTEQGVTSDVLLSLHIPIYTDEECSKLYDKVLKGRTTVNKLCAGRSGQDTCGGDSGGPLLVPGVHNGVTRYIQYGIVSYGPRICASGYPGVYTDVSKYMTWILNNIEE